jgi:hypothetical protein
LAGQVTTPQAAGPQSIEQPQEAEQLTSPHDLCPQTTLQSPGPQVMFPEQESLPRGLQLTEQLADCEQLTLP